MVRSKSGRSISEIVNERRDITPDTALRLARYFNMTPEFWLNLQTSYNLAVTQDKEEAKIDRAVRPMATVVGRRARSSG